jgi:GT2 family glycosyltransferase
MTTMPLFSIVTPVYRPPLAFLSACVQSVLDQTLDDWELVLVDDGNDSAELLDLLAELEASHTGIRVVHSPTNLGIAGASQLGLRHATGHFVALLDHDDTLSPVALERMSDAIGSHPDADYLYSDEDKIDESGAFRDPFFKPDWSPERFRCHMYTCHLGVVRRTLALEVGGFRDGFDGSQDYDLVLRVTEQARQVVHVPEILYHWRAHRGSTALEAEQKPAAFTSAKRALEEHCTRTGIDAEVVDGSGLGTYRLRRRLSSTPLISLVIPTRGQIAPIRGQESTLVEHFIASIEAQSTYDNFEYVVVHDARMPATALSAVKAAAAHPWTAVAYDHDDFNFNFSRAINLGAVHARGDLLVLLNDDMELISPEWLEELAALVSDPSVGAVGGKYYFEDDTIQHAGLTCAAAPNHLLYRVARRPQVFGSHLDVTREVTALTGACLAVTRHSFFAVGGFTERLPNNFNDVDFCLKLRALGLRNIWTPNVELYHFESKTRTNSVDEYEQDRLALRWGARLRNDPYYNPNLVAIPPQWQPYPDWQQTTRSWPQVVGNHGVFEAEAYLELNPDLVAARANDPEWDLAGHFATFGALERRLQAVRRPRHPLDKTGSAISSPSEMSSPLPP